MTRFSRAICMIRSPMESLRTEKLYGWRADEAVGKNSHHLTRTVFPGIAREHQCRIGTDGTMGGELVHTKRDGTSVKVASRWSLQRDDRNRPIGTLETNNDIHRAHSRSGGAPGCLG